MPAYSHYKELRRLDMSSFAAFIEVCEEDAHHIPVFLAELTRLCMPFGIHFDRCSDATKALIREHPLLVAEHCQDDKTVEYTERHKQGIFDKLCDLNRFAYLVHWNSDETWEKDALAKFDAILATGADYVYTKWINTWGDMEHIRTDGPWNSSRVKLYRVAGGKRWLFDHVIIHGCKLLTQDGTIEDDKRVTFSRSDLVCLHHGFQTRELRERHKERWDRIYTTATKGDGNPYGIWKMALDEVTYPPVVSENPYL